MVELVKWSMYPTAALIGSTHLLVDTLLVSYCLLLLLHFVGLMCFGTEQRNSVT